MRRRELNGYGQKSRKPGSSGRVLKLTIHAAFGKDFVPFLQSHVQRAHRLLRTPLRELSLALVGDAHMSRIHKQFLNIDGPTDVMTFPLEFDESENPTSGEVVICVPEARRQSRRSGVPAECEVLLYAIHGMLHLCGLDDRTPAGFAQMHRLEDDLFVRLGMAPAFDAGRHSQAQARLEAFPRSPRESKEPMPTVRSRRRRARLAQSFGV